MRALDGFAEADRRYTHGMVVSPDAANWFPMMDGSYDREG